MEQSMFLTFLLCLRSAWNDERDMILVWDWLPFLSKVTKVVLVAVGTDLIRNSCGAVFYNFGVGRKLKLIFLFWQIVEYCFDHLFRGGGQEKHFTQGDFFRSRSTLHLLTLSPKSVLGAKYSKLDKAASKSCDMLQYVENCKRRGNYRDREVGF